KIGITHGFGAPEGMVEKVQSKFLEKVDMILFGHTHVPHSEEKDGILFFNPGSLSFNTDRRELTYAILEIKDNELAPRLITLDL
ncbi:MAG: metallophosphatase family protein, partial [candidate division Zixibacteria bacterium]|nr:metallophosphatase family protein [candidate division Zixibacteria bacterium]